MGVHGKGGKHLPDIDICESWTALGKIVHQLKIKKSFS